MRPAPSSQIMHRLQLQHYANHIKFGVNSSDFNTNMVIFFKHQQNIFNLFVGESSCEQSPFILLWPAYWQ